MQLTWLSHWFFLELYNLWTLSLLAALLLRRISTIHKPSVPPLLNPTCDRNSSPQSQLFHHFICRCDWRFCAGLMWVSRWAGEQPKCGWVGRSGIEKNRSKNNKDMKPSPHLVERSGIEKNRSKNNKEMKSSPHLYSYLSSVYLSKNLTLVKIVQSNLAYWKIKGFCHYQTDYVKEWAENCFDGGFFIAKSFYQRKEESYQQ